ncbi:MAG: hypothetical protein IPL87_00295 [Candidatus Moraniibacteriota bacterium]|nr:MAG: hypothetical protein IPL87_00295 [Candidatus Moranbacteria bacterium]
MKLLVVPLYLLFFLAVSFTGFFVVFHLLRYSVNKRVARFTVLLFIIGTGILLVSNALLFFSIPFDTITNPLPPLPSESQF